MLTSRNLFHRSLVALVLSVASLDAMAQSAIRQRDALLELLLSGLNQDIDLRAYNPELRAELGKVLKRSRAYRSQRREPVGSELLKMVHSELVQYERLLVSVTDDSRAPAAAAAYVDQLRPCYEWEGYHDCPEREASFAID